MNLGFTGTREGLTDAQRSALKVILEDVKPDKCTHGDCLGADAEFHDMVRSQCPKAQIAIWPGDIEPMRAFKKGDVMMMPAAPLTRNHMIVIECDRLVACPKENTESLRSGTWATVRDARKWKKQLTIIFPDGSIHHERGRVVQGSSGSNSR